MQKCQWSKKASHMIAEAVSGSNLRPVVADQDHVGREENGRSSPSRGEIDISGMQISSNYSAVPSFGWLPKSIIIGPHAIRFTRIINKTFLQLEPCLQHNIHFQVAQ
jgi:hypothetical protein